MDTLESNKLIAEFMLGQGIVKIGKDRYSTVNDLDVPDDDLNLSDLQYHTSWDWLMPVVKRILELDEVAEDMEKYYSIIDNIPNIESTYKAVVEFIKLFNENK